MAGGDINQVSQVFSELISTVLYGIHQVLKQIENLWCIAITCNSALRTGMDDITDSQSLQHLRGSRSAEKGPFMDGQESIM